MADTLHNPTVKSVPNETASDGYFNLQVELDPSGASAYHEVRSVPNILVPSPRVHIVADATYNTAGKLQELGTADRPYNASALNELRTILHGLPDGSSVLLGPGEYIVDVSGAPGIGFYGLYLQKNIIIEGSGLNSTIIKFPDGLTGIDNPASRIVVSIGGANGDALDVSVALRDVKIDCNVSNAVANGLRLVHSGLVTGVKQFYGENIEVVDNGQDQAPGEEFTVFCVSRSNGFNNEVYLNNVNVREEGAPIGTDKDFSASHTAIVVGGDVAGASTRGLVENCKIVKTLSGVGMGALRTNEGITFRDCFVDGRPVDALTAPSTDVVPFLQDTGLVRNLVIDNCHLLPTAFANALIIDSPDVGEGQETTIIRNNLFEIDNGQGGGQGVMRMGNGVDAYSVCKIHDNRLIGVSNQPTLSEFVNLNAVGPGVGVNLHVHDNVCEDTAVANVSGVIPVAAIQYDNYFQDGTPMA